MNTKQNAQQNINRVLPAMTAEAYLKHKEVIEAWLQGADVEYLEALDDTWYYVSNPGFIEQSQYRIKPANIKKYIIVGLMVMRTTIPIPIPIPAVCGVPRLKHAVLMR